MKSSKKIVIVDIDGTISRLGERLKYLQGKKKDWDSFYSACMEDEPVKEVIALVKLLTIEYTIVFCTGRRESVRDLTIKWLKQYFDNTFACSDNLLMRPLGDKRHDTQVKPELLKKAQIELNDIAFVLEDRNSMVEQWRKLGLKCFQVADGDF